MRIDLLAALRSVKREHSAIEAQICEQVAKSMRNLRDHRMLGKYLNFSFFAQPKVSLNADAGDI
jgi:hypothetical protein